MRQPPSPLLLSARKRRLRRNPPHGAQYGAGEPTRGPEPQRQQQPPEQATADEKCALLQRDLLDPRRPGSSQEDEPTASSR